MFSTCSYAQNKFIWQLVLILIGNLPVNKGRFCGLKCEKMDCMLLFWFKSI